MDGWIPSAKQQHETHSAPTACDERHDARRDLAPPGPPVDVLHPQPQVGAHGRVHHQPGRRDRQQPADALACRRGGRGGQREHGARPHHALQQVAQPEVGGAEAVAPLRDAVRLVHADQRQAGQRPQRAHHGAAGELLGPQEQDAQLPGSCPPHHVVDLLARHGALEHGARQPWGQALHLVAHQGDEGGDDHHQAWLGVWCGCCGGGCGYTAVGFILVLEYRPNSTLRP